MLEKFFLISRIALGVIFFVFGLNSFLNFLPSIGIYSNLSIEQSNFIFALKETGFFLPLLNTVQVVIGTFLILNLFCPFSLLVLVPITINIFLFHYFLGTNKQLLNREMLLPCVIILLHFPLLIRNLRFYKSLFRFIPSRFKN